MKDLKTRQICFYFIAFMPIIKIFTLPSILAGLSNQDLWVSAVLSFLLDGITLFLLLNVCKKTDKTFTELLTDTFGKTVTTIILILYFIYFVIKSILPIDEHIQFTELTLYATMPDLLYLLPLFVVMFYFCVKPLRVLGRCADIMWVFTLLGFSFIFALSIKGLDVGALLPVLTNKPSNIFKGTYYSLSWFGDCAYFLFFIGRFKYENKTTLKVLLSFLLGTLLVIAFLLFFYSVYSSIAFRRLFALTELPKYTTVINNTGRFDNIALFLLLSSGIISLAVPLLLASKILEQLTGMKNRVVCPVIVLTLIFVPVIILGRFTPTIRYIITNYFGAYFLILGNVIPILTIFFNKKKEKKYEAIEN